MYGPQQVLETVGGDWHLQCVVYMGKVVKQAFAAALKRGARLRRQEMRFARPAQNLAELIDLLLKVGSAWHSALQNHAGATSLGFTY
jgi:hypothetical protein